ncbi:hypothetical protein BD779DRAFT_472869 [Infundibulicybe gibba]|nr:hypothetical protein BD779DRAFT_472869 [Infundibulicybe gibba]
MCPLALQIMFSSFPCSFLRDVMACLVYSQSGPSNIYLPDSRSPTNPEAIPSGHLLCLFPLHLHKTTITKSILNSRSPTNPDAHTAVVVCRRLFSPSLPALKCTH